MKIVSGFNYVASAGNDQKVIIWKIFDDIREEFIHFRGHSSRVNAVKFIMMDGQVYTVSGDENGSIKVWNVVTLSIHSEFTLLNSVKCIVVSSSRIGKPPIIAVTDTHGNLFVWDLSTGLIRFSIICSTFCHFIRTITIYDDHDERLIICGCDNGTILFLTLSSGVVQYEFVGHKSWVTALHITDGVSPVLVSGGCDSKIKCWDLSYIFKNIKFNRRKFFLLFLVGSKLLPSQKSKSSSLDLNWCNAPCHTAQVFSNKDICLIISKYL